MTLRLYARYWPECSPTCLFRGRRTSLIWACKCRATCPEGPCFLGTVTNGQGNQQSLTLTNYVTADLIVTSANTIHQRQTPPDSSEGIMARRRNC